MNKIRSIRIVSTVYPLPRHPERGRFAANLAEAWSAQGIAVSVLTTVTLGGLFKTAKRRPENVDIPNVVVTVQKVFGTPIERLLPVRLKNLLNDRRAAKLKATQVSMPRADLVYAQFALAGRFARDAHLATGEPYFVDLGESNTLLSGPKTVTMERCNVLRGAAGVVCVSPRLLDEALELGCKPERVELIPNYPNWDKFRPMDMSECRRRLGLDPDVFIVVYVGRFSVRKGAPRLNEALKKMKLPVQAAFLGTGDLMPDFEGVIHAESVSHELLPVWLNAANVLALPTLAEGCCNAIAEALACGLPIMSSDIPDIRWQVPDKGTLLVNPEDPDIIAATLDMLAGDPVQLADMRAALIAQTNENRDKNRAGEILTWMTQRLEFTSGAKQCETAQDG